MKWSFLETIFVCIAFLRAGCALVESNLNDDLDYHPQVAISCDKVTRHVDVNTGDWIADKNSTRLCTTDKTKILEYCKAVYPSKDVRNIVEANNRVLVDKSMVNPYRCLVGSFESDALLVPPKCRFEHMHYNTDCQMHDQWHERASKKCISEGMVVKDYGVLIPCGVGTFSGVEFVCCPDDASEDATDAVKIVPVSEAASTSEPMSVLEHLKMEISKFAKHVNATSVGCDSKKYHDLRDKLEDTRRGKVQTLIEHWEQAEERYRLLKASDEDQAASSISEEIENFKKSLETYDEQAKLERARLKEEHHQCMQIDLNDKKNQALRDFVAALQEVPRDGNKILEAVQRFVNTCSQDRLHNLRYFEYVQKHHPEKVEESREALQNHLKNINNLVNESMILLYKLPDIAREFQLDLPDWIPKPPALPTEAPTVDKSSAAKDPTDPPSQPDDLTGPTEDFQKEDDQKPSGFQPAARKEDDDDDPEDVTENEEAVFRQSHSRATFSAVIGLSCGALVIMIIIVVAMAMRRPRPNHNTKTVLVDTDTEGASEKSHLVNMQENGYENPTYKFYDY